MIELTTQTRQVPMSFDFFICYAGSQYCLDINQSESARRNSLFCGNLSLVRVNGKNQKRQNRRYVFCENRC